MLEAIAAEFVATDHQDESGHQPDEQPWPGVNGTAAEQDDAQQQRHAAEDGTHVDHAARVLGYKAHHNGHNEDSYAPGQGCRRPVHHESSDAESSAQGNDHNGEDGDPPGAHRGHSHAAFQGTSCGYLEIKKI